MRTAPIGTLFLVVSLLIACGDDDKVKKDDTADSNTAPTSHPLVPDDYQTKWDWDASGCEDGKSAVYHLAEGYSVQESISGDDEMVLYVSERWFWFHGKDDFDGDCVDQFDYRGVATRYAWGANDPCGTCEEEYWGSYNENTEVENGCNIGYDGIIATDAGSQNAYDTVVFKFDTLTMSGEPNQDNALLVYHAILWDGYFSFDSSYAKGTVLPDATDDYGGPSQYEWVNLTTLCI